MKLVYKISLIFLTIIAVSIGLIVLQDSLNLPTEINLAQLGPGLVALFFTFIVFKESNVRPFLIEKKDPSYMVIFVVLLPFLLAIVAKTLHAYINDTFTAADVLSGSNLWYLFIWLPIGAFMEELGWRNYLQRLLDKETKFYPCINHIIIGIFWSIWSLQFYEFGFLFIVGQTFLLVSASIVLGDYLNRRGQNIITSTLAHISINMSIIYIMYTDSYTALTSVLYGGTVFLFMIYYMFNLKKSNKR